MGGWAVDLDLECPASLGNGLDARDEVSRLAEGAPFRWEGSLVANCKLLVVTPNSLASPHRR